MRPGNVGALLDAAERVKCIGKPFCIIGGDFDATPQELEEEGVLK